MTFAGVSGILLLVEPHFISEWDWWLSGAALVWLIVWSAVLRPCLRDALKEDGFEIRSRFEHGLLYAPSLLWLAGILGLLFFHGLLPEILPPGWHLLCRRIANILTLVGVALSALTVFFLPYLLAGWSRKMFELLPVLWIAHFFWLMFCAGPALVVMVVSITGQPWRN